MSYDATGDAWASYGAAQDALRERHEAIMAAGAKRIVYIGDAVLIEGDCLQVLPTLGRVDAVVTDPPYCSGAVSESARTAAKGQGLRSDTITKLGWFVGDNMGTAGLVSLLRSMAVRSLDILNPEGSVLVFCDWRMVPNLAPTIESAGLRFQNMVVWDKGMMGLGMGFRAQHEIILHYTAGAPKYYNLGVSNVIRTARVSATEREHQTQKPIDLMEQLLSVVCDFGQTVVDPFMGSGSTGVAAIRRGAKFIGIERDREHFATACKRIEEAWRQPRLFDEPKAKPEPAPTLFDGDAA